MPPKSNSVEVKTGSPEFEASINTNKYDMGSVEAAMIDNISSEVTEETDVEINPMKDGQVSDVVSVNDNIDKTNNHAGDENIKAEENISDGVNSDQTPSGDAVREEVEKIGGHDFKVLYFVSSELEPKLFIV